jgi:poly(ADP-ribose) glycohydrolase ARH3
MSGAAPTLQERFRGAIVGTAVGDALGAPFEGNLRVAADAVRRWAADGGALRWTDDTAMTISVAESLIARGGFDGGDLMRRFVVRYRAEPDRGYGGGPPQIFAAVADGAAWDEPAQQLFGGTGSYGNGAAMRVAPVGLFHHDALHRVAEVARDTARLTHTHALGLQGAAVQAYAVAWLTGARHEPGRSSAGALLAEVRRVGPAPQLQAAFDVIADVQQRRDSGQHVDPDEIARRVGTGIAAVEAVPAALHATLANPGSFADAVTYAVALGGDTDTVAAMAGALSGVLLGHRAIPTAWLDRLEDHERLVTLADDLLTAAS